MLQALLSSHIRNPTKAFYDGEDRDEDILYLIRKSSITNIPWIVATIVLAVTPLLIGPYLLSLDPTRRLFTFTFSTLLIVFWYLFTFGYALQSFLNWFFNVYIITNKKIVDIDFHGISYKNISEAALRNVEDVTSTIHGPIGLIFNLGDVHIQTSAERREFEFESVRKPAKIRDIVFDLADKSLNGHI